LPPWRAYLRRERDFYRYHAATPCSTVPWLPNTAGRIAARFESLGLIAALEEIIVAEARVLATHRGAVGAPRARRFLDALGPLH
jgi:hypothetical protein